MYGYLLCHVIVPFTMYGYLFCPVIAFDQNSVSSKFCNSGQPEFKQCLMILMTGYF
jgi:hypothetical protein